MNKKNIIVISAPSCSGKNSIYNEVQKKYPNIVQTVSDTTRKIRANEKEGVDYNYISVKAFKENIENGYYIEHNFYNGNYYGTPTSQVFNLANGEDPVILIIDVNGALKVKKLFGDKVLLIFIMPPSLEALEKRMIERGENTPEELKERLEIAKYEISQADKYDFCVVNDVLSKASENVIDIIKKEIMNGDE